MFKIGIVGCGGISRVHLDILSQISDVEISAICDVDEKKLLEFKKKYGAKKIFSDFKELMREEVDVILCCVPTHLHAPVIVEAAKKGKDIFCEKPLAMTMEDALEMEEVCKKNRVKFQIGFVRRFDSEWLKLKELIQKGTIGRPVLWRGANAGSGPNPKWFFEKEKGGGPFVDGCVHNYDFSRFIFGETKEAKASLFRFKKESAAFDTGTALVKFKSEDEIMLSWSWGLPKGCSGQNIHDILGPKGTIFFPSQEPKFIINLADEKKEFVEVEKESLDKAFKLQMEHFISCIKEDKNPSVGFEEGIKSLEIALAVLKSADKGETIYL